jgi:hypothetical protein
LFEVGIHIKIKAIEDIYHQATEKEAKYYTSTQTLGNNLFAIIDYFDNGDGTGSKSINKRHLMENEEDINTIVKVFPRSIEEYVLPYFESNSNIDQVDKLLNENPQELSVHYYLYPLRACIGIIAAKLTHNPRYNEVLKIYEVQLQEANTIFKKEFEKLKLLLSKEI